MAEQVASFKPRRSGFLIGTLNMRLGADPEKFVFGERCVVKVRGAVNHLAYSKDEGTKEETAWYSGEFWSGVDEDGNPFSPANALYSRYKKGDWVTLLGRLEPTKWAKGDKNGTDLKFVILDLPYDNMPFVAADDSDREEDEEEEEPVAIAMPRRTSTRKPAVAAASPRGANPGRRASTRESADFEWS